MMTTKQALTNRQNSRKSTGPKTPEGKAKASSNAIKHGIFARTRFLDDESPEEFRLLLDGLQMSLCPAGSLEHALVERIAVTLLRQQRLVRAETATIELSRRLDAKANRNEIETALGMTYPNQVNDEDLTLSKEVGGDYLASCSRIAEESLRLDRRALAATDLDHLEQAAPTLHRALSCEAEEADAPLPEFIRSYKGGLSAWVKDVANGCRSEIAAIRRSALIGEVAALVRSSRSAPLQQELISKYQTALDHELYRAIRALRETQEWRLKTLESGDPMVAQQLTRGS
ncbi:hypothetical protein [Cupriavidus pinatubonensis]|uniref:hypothetical protein n=1 Tax=Cupriavidus pinatubonensis TaxID=248026 RepID=UPI00112747AA|nr:hypothetical protein [Cupriavidus pinatubonensis]TPQ30922.1 hypothetical protein C2U69_29985 [Cupriavidus pinatubonensis]